MLPALGHRWNRSQLIITSLLVSAVLIALVPFALNTMWLDLAAMAVAGFFVGITQSLTMTMVVKQVSTAWRSPALAVRLMGNRLGQVVISAGGRFGGGTAGFSRCHLIPLPSDCCFWGGARDCLREDGVNGGRPISWPKNIDQSIETHISRGYALNH